MMIIDARDAAQYAKEHVLGAINIEWRLVMAKSGDIPKNNPVLIYCSTESLLAQADFARRVSGWENVRILQGGFSEWKSKGGLDANAKTSGASPKH